MHKRRVPVGKDSEHISYFLIMMFFELLVLTIYDMADCTVVHSSPVTPLSVIVPAPVEASCAPWTRVCLMAWSAPTWTY